MMGPGPSCPTPTYLFARLHVKSVASCGPCVASKATVASIYVLVVRFCACHRPGFWLIVAAWQRRFDMTMAVACST